MEIAKDRFAEFVLPEIDILHRVARRLVGTSSDADDLLQDCLLNAFRSITAFDGQFPRAWLFTILRNTHLNRTRIKKPILIDDWTFLDSKLQRFDLENQNQSRSSEEIYFEGSLSESLMTGIQQLKPEFREVIYLVDIEGFSYEESAVLLGIKTATVTSRLSRARTKLRETLVQNKVFQGKGQRL